VSEAAAKAVAAADGPEAVAGLLAMLADSRPYLRVIGAGGLGRLRAAEAVPALLKGAQAGDPLVRVACLQALAGIGLAPGVGGDGIGEALVAALNDREGTVKLAALHGLTRLAARAGGDREAIIQALVARTADPNPAVVAATFEALIAFGVPEDRRAKLMDDQLMYGGPHAGTGATNLTAGPIRLKFQDGELRYLYVGDREIVRRVYFAVRDKLFDTVMPEFSRMEVRSEGGGFAIRLEAVCRGATADYRWTGEIAGTAEGRITFRWTGRPTARFPRRASG